MTPSPTQSNVISQLRAFLTAVLPATGPDGLPVDIIQAQPNRVPEPRGSSFVLMTPLRFPRLRTNVNTYEDAAFTGSIAGATMTITAVDDRFPDGKIGVGSVVFGAGLASPTTVAAVLTGAGQVGTYSVSPPQTVGSRTLSAGAESIEQAGQWTIQLDFHGDPKADISGDMAATVSTLFRDGFAVEQFANQSPDYGVVPLYADDPAQRPFVNDQRQVENRWVVEAMLQANIVVSVPKQFADSVALDVVSVEATFPPP